ncbi:hypothetical protein GCM10009663_51870 [Kitasatospora arboriphila]|uniref:Ricin B lectin domain-containing protein n=1 Tax=Kitasatospora arboriphila TaxID=258052 RepID=A0ABN1TU18_9ACTN
MSLRTGRRGTVLPAAALTATAAGISWASIPDGSGRIHACYQRSTGLVRVIDSPSQQCRGGESPLNWSQGGPSAVLALTACRFPGRARSTTVRTEAGPSDLYKPSRLPERRPVSPARAM